eukprot:1159431-Pelagomonas_calceolata.AAC.6
MVHELGRQAFDCGRSARFLGCKPTPCNPCNPLTVAGWVGVQRDGAVARLRHAIHLISCTLLQFCKGVGIDWALLCSGSARSVTRLCSSIMASTSCPAFLTVTGCVNASMGVNASTLAVHPLFACAQAGLLATAQQVYKHVNLAAVVTPTEFVRYQASGLCAGLTVLGVQKKTLRCVNEGPFKGRILSCWSMGVARRRGAGEDIVQTQETDALTEMGALAVQVQQAQLTHTAVLHLLA